MVVSIIGGRKQTTWVIHPSQERRQPTCCKTGENRHATKKETTDLPQERRQQIGHKKGDNRFDVRTETIDLPQEKRPPACNKKGDNRSVTRKLTNCMIWSFKRVVFATGENRINYLVCYMGSLKKKWLLLL
jgi:hypothetical protein